MAKQRATTNAASAASNQPAPAAPALPATDGAARMGAGDSSARPDVAAVAAMLRGEGLTDGEGQGEETQEGAANASEGEAEGEGIAETENEGQGEAEGEGEAGGDGETISVAELAKALGAKPGEIMDNLKIEVDIAGDDGTKTVETVSLGDLRRGYIGAKKLETERQAFEETSQARELEYMTTRADIEALAETVLPYAPPGVAEQIQGARAVRLQREQKLMLEAMPDWRDKNKFAADREAMINFLKPWGYTAADVYAIGDHRAARFVRDMARKHERAAKAADNARKPTVKAGQAPAGRKFTPLRARLDNIVKAGRSATTEAGKHAAVVDLLRTTGVK